MQTLEAVLEQRVSDNYMETSKKVIDSKISGGSNNTGSEADKCEEPEKNGVEPVRAPLEILVTKGPLVKKGPVAVGEASIVKAATNGVKSSGTFRLIARRSFPTEVANTHGALQYKKLNGSVTISNGKLRLLPGSNGNSKDESVFKTPVIIPCTGVPRKKIRMSTVAKQVPLINTVGNQSKLYPISAVTQSQVPPAPSVNGAVSETSAPTVPQATKVLKSMSILEARLTSPASNGNLLPILNSCENELVAPSLEVPGGLESVLSPNENDVTETIGSISSESCNSSEQSKSFYFDKKIVNLNPNKSKVVLSYERGTIRLAAMESRTITMVDVGTQVSLPNTEEQYFEGTDTCPQTQLPSQQTYSSELSGSVQPAAAAPTEPIIRKPVVVLDHKNGKKIFTIPKHLLSNYSGPKTFIIDGKPVKRKSETPLEYLLNGFENATTVQSSDIMKLQQHQRELSAVGAKSNIIVSSNITTMSPDSHLAHNNVVTVVSSLSSDTVTTSSSLRQLSITSPVPTQKSSSCSNAIHLTPSNNSFNLSSIQAVANSNVLSQTPKTSSDSLVLPFSPIKCGATNNADSVASPLNTPIRSSSFVKSCDSSSMRTLPNTTSLFILIPNRAPQQPEPDPSFVNNQMGDIPGLVDDKHLGFKCKDNSESADNHPIRKKCTDSRSFANTYVELQSGKTGFSSNFVSSLKPIANGFLNQSKLQVNSASAVGKTKTLYQNLSETGGKVCLNSSIGVNNSQGPISNSLNPVGSNLNEAANPVSREEVDKFVKMAFIEFKNCLVLNQEGRLPIHSAIERNDYASVNRQCIVLKARRASVNLPNSKDETPLQLALYHGYSSIAQLLLKHGADANIVDHDGNSTLHLAVMNVEDAVESILLSGQLDKKLINLFNDEGFSPLHLAAQHDKVRAIGWLIESGAEVDLPDGKSGRTALFHAVERKNYGAQRALLSCGADIKEPTFCGSTPFLLTKSDAISQLTSNQNAVVEIIDSDALLQSTTRSRTSKVK